MSNIQDQPKEQPQSSFNFAAAFGDAEQVMRAQEQNHFESRNQNYAKDIIKPNLKNTFVNYAANIQTFSIATKQPTFKFDKKEIQKEFEQFLFVNQFLRKFQNLETNLFKLGKYAFGIRKNANGNLKIQSGIVINYQYDSNMSLSKLLVQVDTATNNSLNYAIVEDWDLSRKDSYVQKYAIEQGTNSNKELGSINYRNNFEELNSYEQIPYIIFFNRWNDSNELNDIDESFFKILNSNMKFLDLDTRFSSPIFYANDDEKEDFNKALFSDENRVVSQTMQSQFLRGAPANLFQGNPQSTFLVQKMDKLFAWIKDFGLLKKDSSSLGSKNLQTTEAMSLSSNYEDNIESKANLREMDLIMWVYLWFQLKEYKVEITDIDVIVAGSTKWLQSEAVKYLGTQDGNTKKIASNSKDAINGTDTKQEKQDVED
ncbi:hypothetical protein [[Mycoplasma] testudinis]|uniref:hypothetical protein n=1 Tax=[Mycoplasma] testudinis TaxID=33924 RepID=UPI0004832229|nr:hypothetical protein [[Mycoplasma] testudinis]